MSKALSNKKKLNDIVDVVADYGADPTGVADSTAAIQAAIDYLNGLGGGIVKFPRGTYISNNVILKSGVTLRSDAEAFGYLPGSLSTVVLKNTTAAGWVIDTSVGGSSACAIEGITFSGSGAATPLIGGVRVRAGSSWVQIKRCSFNGFALSAIQADASSIAGVFEDILTTNCLLSSTLAAVTGVVDINGSDHFLNRLEVAGSLSALNSASLYFSAIVIRGQNHFVDNCIGEFADVGIYILSGTTSYSNCRADNNFGPGWYINGSGNSIVNCRAYTNSKSTANTYSGFYVASNQVYNNISNCQSVNASGSVKYGLEDNSVGASYQQRSTVNNFISVGHGTAPIFSVYQGAGVQIPNYHIQDAVTGSHTVDVTGASIIWLTQASASTITNFTGGIFGQTIRVFGNANVTINNGSGIFTNTGANKTLVANKIYTFTTMGLGSAWYENAGLGQTYLTVSSLPSAASAGPGARLFVSDANATTFASIVAATTSTLTTVAITGTAGQFSCAAASISVGMPVKISGTFGGTGSITGYTDPKTYYVIATNGTTTFTLSETYGGPAIATTAGTPTGLTYTISTSNNMVPVYSDGTNWRIG